MGDDHGDIMNRYADSMGRKCFFPRTPKSGAPLLRKTGAVSYLQLYIISECAVIIHCKNKICKNKIAT